MSQSEQTVSETTNQGDGVTNQPVSGESQPQSETKTVSWEDHQRALADLHKFKAKARELESSQEEAEKKRLVENEQWKQLAEINEKKFLEAEEKRKRQNDTILNHTKYETLKRVAVSNGIRKEALEDLDLLSLESIEVEATTSGRFNVHGAEDYVTRLKKLKPHWFNDSTAPRVNSGGGGAPPQAKKHTPESLMMIERKHGYRSAEYKKAFQEYTQQQKG